MKSRACASLVVGTLWACSGHPEAPSDAAATSTSAAMFVAPDGTSLQYVVDLPTGRGPFPAVVFGHGSGRTTKDELASLVPFLTREGVAVLRYDKRGVGGSGGTYRGLSAANSDSQIAELAGDMVAAVQALGQRADIDRARVGVAGVSQAGWVMAEAARRSADIHFAVHVVGSVMPVGVNIFYENLPKDIPLTDAYAQLRAYDGPQGWDPWPALAASRTPMIWLLGADDRLVPTGECLPRIAQLEASGRTVRTIVYPGRDHALAASGATYWPDAIAWLRRSGVL